MRHFDVAVIGGGPGGYVAAIRTACMGKKTAIIEKDALGGVCLNWGCIPTKSLLRHAETARLLQEEDVFGVPLSDIRAAYAKAQARSRQVSARLVKGIEYLIKKNKITVFKDTGRLTDSGEIRLEQLDQRLSAEDIVLATGSSPARLPFLDYSKPCVLDPQKALQIEAAPRSLIIIGAGAIGMEFASIFSAYGTEVTVVELCERVLPAEDADISALIREKYEKNGVRIITGAAVTACGEANGRQTIRLTQGGKTIDLAGDYILSAAGVTPNSTDIGLETRGAAVDKRGYIVTDAALRASVPGLYAVGDVTGRLALAHTASAQAILAADHICKRPAHILKYEHIPKCTYTTPETASAGLTEQAAVELGYQAASAVFPMSANGKAISCGDGAGFVKLVYDKRYRQLLGAHLAGAHVTEMIWGIAGYLGMEMTVDEMKNVVHPHPTLSEAIMEAAYLACGEAIHI